MKNNPTSSCNVLVGNRPTSMSQSKQDKTNIEGTPREGIDSKLPAFELFETFPTFNRAISVTDCTVT
jgi:hypothetical protein